MLVVVNGKQRLNIEKETDVHIVQILKHFRDIMIYGLFFRISQQNGMHRKMVAYFLKMSQKDLVKKFGGYVRKGILMICMCLSVLRVEIALFVITGESFVVIMICRH